MILLWSWRWRNRIQQMHARDTHFILVRKKWRLDFDTNHALGTSWQTCRNDCIAEKWSLSLLHQNDADKVSGNHGHIDWDRCLCLFMVHQTMLALSPCEFMSTASRSLLHSEFKRTVCRILMAWKDSRMQDILLLTVGLWRSGWYGTFEWPCETSEASNYHKKVHILPSIMNVVWRMRFQSLLRYLHRYVHDMVTTVSSDDRSKDEKASALHDTEPFMWTAQRAYDEHAYVNCIVHVFWNQVVQYCVSYENGVGVNTLAIDHTTWYPKTHQKVFFPNATALFMSFCRCC